MTEYGKNAALVSRTVVLHAGQGAESSGGRRSVKRSPFHYRELRKFLVQVETMTPSRSAYRTRLAIDLRPSFFMILARCVSVVLMLIFSTSEIDRLLWPSATSCMTSRSRRVSGE